MTSETATGPEDLYHQGWHAYAEAKYDEAIRQFQQALANKPGEVDVLYALGMSYEAAGNAHEAIQAYQNVLANLPDVSNRVRAGMVGRLAKGHISKINTGDWGGTSPLKKE